MSGLGIFDPLLNRQRTDDTKTVHISGGGSNQAPVAGGSGVPTGGTTGQMLAKINATDFNTEWVDPPTSGIDPDTEENLLSSTPDGSGYVIATDTLRGLYYNADNTQWYITSIPLSTDNANPDAGYTQDSDKRGYGLDYLDNKRATNFAMGLWSLPNPPEGAISIDGSTSPPTFYVYLNGQWNTLIYNFVVDTDYGLTHIPFLTYQLRVRNGDSVETGLNDQPMVKGYQMDVGAYPSRKRIIGSNLGA